MPADVSQLKMFHRTGRHSLLPPRSPNRWAAGDRSAPTTRSPKPAALYRLPPSVRGGLLFSAPMARLGLDAEELVDGVEELGSAQPALLDVDHGSVFIVEHGHR